MTCSHAAASKMWFIWFKAQEDMYTKSGENHIFQSFRTYLIMEHRPSHMMVVYGEEIITLDSSLLCSHSVPDLQLTKKRMTELNKMNMNI